MLAGRRCCAGLLLRGAVETAVALCYLGTPAAGESGQHHAQRVPVSAKHEAALNQTCLLPGEVVQPLLLCTLLLLLLVVGVQLPAASTPAVAAMIQGHSDLCFTALLKSSRFVCCCGLDPIGELSACMPC